MLKGVTYNRFSSTMQREESIDAQIRFNREYAKRNNIEIIKDYCDEAMSGKTDDRPAFQQMLKDAKMGLFDVVICHKVDRFARNRIESAINKYSLRKCNIKVVFSGQAIDDSPEGQLMEGILESFAEYYSLNLAKETMKGLRENAYKCRFNGGYVPFGYSVDPVTKAYIINDKEAPYVQLIFKMYNDGAKYPLIISTLKQLGIKTRHGKDFTYASIHDLLCNEKYAGVYTFNRRASRNIDGKRNNRSYKDESEIIRIPDGIPQIIDTETFLITQELMVPKKRSTRKAKEVYLLSGLVFCGECEKPYCGSRKHNGSGKVYTMYRCNGRCSNTEVDKEILEEIVFQKLIENIFSRNALTYLSKKLNSYLKGKKQQENKQLEFLKSRINEITFEQNNIISAIAKGYDQPIFNQKLTSLDEELKKIRYDYEITKLKLDTKEITPGEIEKNLLSQREHVLNRNIIEVKNFISSYVNSVIIYKDDIEVNLKYDSMPI
ncbi:recombinase family protein [Clostridium sp. BSD9I1]|uniref:recombinase family protein n=1 Tax=Clostridium sp. BSD9I1 TaxID=2003589 RepID=UPI0016474D1A|nr:recombinase family protein [Clostridium sp. BSD9I1]